MLFELLKYYAFNMLIHLNSNPDNVNILCFLAGTLFAFASVINSVDYVSAIVAGSTYLGVKMSVLGISFP